MKTAKCWIIGAVSLALNLGVLSLSAQDTPSSPLEMLLQTLAVIEDPRAQAGVLRGMNASLKGQRNLPVPAAWEQLYPKLLTSPNEEVRRQTQALAATFGGSAALEEMRKTLSDAAAQPDARKAALDSLLAAKDAATRPLLIALLKQPGPLRLPALRGLASYNDAGDAAAILGAYPTFDTAEKRDALNTLLARPASVRALLAAIDAKAIPRSDITAPLARQLQNIKEPDIQKWVAKNWGTVRTSSADKQKEIERFKKFLGTDAILRADASRGRAFYIQTCAVCHAIFGEGGKIGPELPGAFEDVDYLLQNILDPNALIGKDYQQTFITTKSGQLVAGIISSEDAREVVLKTLADPITVPRADIAELKTSEHSMMPEGLLMALDEQGVRDLFLYLRQRQQVPLKSEVK
jgi:putative heme-binding domain-containing protein